MKLKEFVLGENNIINEKDVYDVLSFEGVCVCVVDCISVLFDGSDLKGPVLKNGENFKVAKTGMRKTHEIVWNNEIPPAMSHILNISDITTPKIVTAGKLRNYKPTNLLLIFHRFVE